jgi:opacity protein-like surface antigen
MRAKASVHAGAVLVLFLLLAGVAEAQQARSTESRTGRFVFGASLGLQGDTADGSAFALGFNGDYYVTQGFSIGPLLQMGFTGDLFQLGLTAQAKYTFDLPQAPRLKPHVEAGIGFIHAQLDQPAGNEHDTSFLIPIGGGVEYKLNDRISLDTTLLFNFTDLKVQDEDFFVTWLVGVRIPF